MSDSSPQIEPTSTTASFQPTSSSGQGKKLLSKSEKKSKDQENPILIGLGKSVAYKNGKIVLPKSSTTLLRGKIDIGGAHIIIGNKATMQIRSKKRKTASSLEKMARQFKPGEGTQNDF